MPQRDTSSDITYPTAIQRPRGLTRAWKKWFIAENVRGGTNKIHCLSDTKTNGVNDRFDQLDVNLGDNPLGLAYYHGEFLVSDVSNAITRYRLKHDSTSWSNFDARARFGFDVQGGKAFMMKNRINRFFTADNVDISIGGTFQDFVFNGEDIVVGTSGTNEKFYRATSAGLEPPQTGVNLFSDTENNNETIVAMYFDGVVLWTIIRTGDEDQQINWRYDRYGYKFPNERTTITKTQSEQRLSVMNGMTVKGMTKLHGKFYLLVNNLTKWSLMAYNENWTRDTSADFDIANLSATGLTTDGTYLYTIQSNIVRAYHPITKQAVPERDIPVRTHDMPNPTALDFKNGTLWLGFPNGTNKVSLRDATLIEYDYVDDADANTSFTLTRPSATVHFEGMTHDRTKFVNYLPGTVDEFVAYQRYGGSPLGQIRLQDPPSEISGYTTRGVYFDGSDYWIAKTNTTDDKLLRFTPDVTDNPYAVKDLKTRDTLYQRVYETSAIRPKIEQIDLGGESSINSIAIDGDYIYVNNDESHHINRVHTGTHSKDLPFFTYAQTYEFTGLTFHDGELYCTDRLNNRVVVYTPRETGNDGADILAPNRVHNLTNISGEARAITYKDGVFAVIDSRSGARSNIVFYDKNFNYLGSRLTPIRSTDRSWTSQVQAIASDGRYWYCGDYQTNRILVETGTFTDGIDNQEALQFSIDPPVAGYRIEGLDIQGGTLWVAWNSTTSSTTHYATSHKLYGFGSTITGTDEKKLETRTAFAKRDNSDSATGLANDGTHLFTVSSHDRALIEYDTDGTNRRQVGSFTESFGIVTGVARTTNKFYIFLYKDLAPATSSIVQMTHAGSVLSTRLTIGTNTPNPVGGTFHNGKLYVLDNSNNQIDVYNVTAGSTAGTNDSLAYSTSYSLPNKSWGSVCNDGIHLWCLNTTDNEMYALDLSGNHISALDFDIDDPQTGYGWTGSTIIGNKMYIMQQKNDVQNALVDTWQQPTIREPKGTKIIDTTGEYNSLAHHNGKLYSIDGRAGHVSIDEFELDGSNQSNPTSVSLPAGVTGAYAGMCVNSSGNFVIVTATNRAFEINASGDLVSQHTLIGTSTTAEGITLLGDKYYVVQFDNRGNKRIRVYNSSFQHQSSEDTLITAAAKAITNDGTYLYLRDGGKLIAIDPTTKARVPTQDVAVTKHAPALDGFELEGMDYANNTFYLLWAESATGRRIDQYPMSTQTPLLVDQDKIQGVAKHDGKVWVLDNTDNVLQPYDDDTDDETNPSGTPIQLFEHTWISVTNDENYFYILANDNIIYCYNESGRVSARDISIKDVSLPSGYSWQQIMIWDDVMYLHATTTASNTADYVYPLQYKEHDYLAIPRYPGEFSYVASSPVSVNMGATSIPQPDAFAWDGTHWYVMEDSNRELFKFNDSFALQTPRNQRVGGTSSQDIYGIVWTGTRLVYFSTRGWGTINTSTLVSSNPIGDNAPILINPSNAITFYEDVFYVPQRRGVYMFSFDGTTASYLGRFDTVASDPLGIAAYEGVLYIVGENKHVYVYDIGTKRRKPEREFDATGPDEIHEALIRDHRLYLLGRDTSDNKALRYYDLRQRDFSRIDVGQDIRDGAITTNNNYFFVVSDHTNNIYKVSIHSGAVELTIGLWNTGSTVNQDPVGATLHGNEIAVLDKDSKHIFLYNDHQATQSLQVQHIKRLPPTITDLRGITWFNGLYWVVAGRNIYLFGDTPHTVLPAAHITLTADANDFDCITHDDNYVYVLMSSEDVHVFDRNGTRIHHRDVQLDEYSGDNDLRNLSGITHTNGLLYILDGGTNNNARVFPIKLRKDNEWLVEQREILGNSFGNARTVGSHSTIPLALANTSPLDVAAQFTNVAENYGSLYVLDRVKRHIYVYDLDAGWWDEVKSFALNSDTREPESITINDGKLYVLNNTATSPSVHVYNISLTGLHSGFARRLSLDDIALTQDSTGYDHIAWFNDILLVRGKGGMTYGFVNGQHGTTISNIAGRFGFDDYDMYHYDSGNVVKRQLALESHTGPTVFSGLDNPRGLSVFNDELIAISDKTPGKEVISRTPVFTATQARTYPPNPTPETVIDNIVLPPGASIQGATSDDTTMWLLDNNSKRVYQYTIDNSGSTPAISTVNSGSFLVNTTENVRGITKGPDRFYILADTRILEYTLSGLEIPFSTSLTIPTTRRLGITYYNNKLWVAVIDTGTNSHYVHAYDTSTRESTTGGFRVSDANIGGIATDDNRFWMFYGDGWSRYDISDTSVGNQTNWSTSGIDNVYREAGCMYSNDRIYGVLQHNTNNTLRMLPLKVSDSAKAVDSITLDTANSDPEGLASDDTYLYVADGNGRQLYVYPGVGAQDHAKIDARGIDFTEETSLGSPHGLHVYNDKLYVLNDYDPNNPTTNANKIFAWLTGIFPSKELVISYAMPYLRKALNVSYLIKRPQYWHYQRPPHTDITHRLGAMTIVGNSLYIITSGGTGTGLTLKKYNKDTFAAERFTAGGVSTENAFIPKPSGASGVNVQDMTWDGSNLFLASNNDDRLWKISNEPTYDSANSREVLGRVDMSVTGSRTSWEGMAWNGEHIIVVDTEAGEKFERRNTSLGAIDSQTINFGSGAFSSLASADHVNGMDFDEQNYYCVVSNNITNRSKLVVINRELNKLEFETDLPTAITHPVGIVKDGDRVIIANWVTAGSNNGLYVFRYVTPVIRGLPISFEILSSLISPKMLNILYSISRIPAKKPLSMIYDIPFYRISPKALNIVYDINEYLVPKILNISYKISRRATKPLNIIYEIFRIPASKRLRIRYRILRIPAKKPLQILYSIAENLIPKPINISYKINEFRKSKSLDVIYHMLNFDLRLGNRFDVTYTDDITQVRSLSRFRDQWAILGNSEQQRPSDRNPVDYDAVHFVNEDGTTGETENVDWVEVDSNKAGLHIEGNEMYVLNDDGEVNLFRYNGTRWIFDGELSYREPEQRRTDCVDILIVPPGGEDGTDGLVAIVNEQDTPETKFFTRVGSELQWFGDAYIYMAGTDPRGLTADESYFYMVDNTGKQVIAYNRRNGEGDDGDEYRNPQGYNIEDDFTRENFPLDTNNQRPRGIYVFGKVVWVLENNRRTGGAVAERMLYAYNTELSWYRQVLDIVYSIPTYTIKKPLNILYRVIGIPKKKLDISYRITGFNIDPKALVISYAIPFFRRVWDLGISYDIAHYTNTHPLQILYRIAYTFIDPKPLNISYNIAEYRAQGDLLIEYMIDYFRRDWQLPISFGILGLRPRKQLGIMYEIFRIPAKKSLDIRYRIGAIVRGKSLSIQYKIDNIEIFNSLKIIYSIQKILPKQIIDFKYIRDKVVKFFNE